MTVHMFANFLSEAAPQIFNDFPMVQFAHNWINLSSECFMPLCAESISFRVFLCRKSPEDRRRTCHFTNSHLRDTLTAAAPSRLTPKISRTVLPKDLTSSANASKSDMVRSWSRRRPPSMWERLGWRLEANHKWLPSHFTSTSCRDCRVGNGKSASSACVIRLFNTRLFKTFRLAADKKHSFRSLLPLKKPCCRKLRAKRNLPVLQNSNSWNS